VEAVAGEVAADVVVAEAAEEVAVVVGSRRLTTAPRHTNESQTGTLAATLLRCATAAGDRVAT
jgi:hypothetical protein